MKSAGRIGKESPRWRILVVDDHPDNVEIIAARLRFRGYRVEHASRGDEALRKVRADPPDLILLDVMLPGLDGREVARRIKADETLPYIPIILVTARGSTEDKVEGLDAGADDYLTKPIDFPELEARVRSMLRIKRLQDELAEKNRELETLSISDGLTGLFNYRHIHELAHDEFERAKRTGEPVTVVMFDLDHFKDVNDTHGHQAGDRVLRTMAEILEHTAREIDKLGRYGGEEFVAILPDTSVEEGTVFAERVRERVEKTPFPISRRSPIFMTVSGGVAGAPRPGVTDPGTLIHMADEALYAAKKRGRNCVVRYQDLEAERGSSRDRIPSTRA